MSSFYVYETIYQLYALLIEFGLEWMSVNLQIEAQLDHLAQALPSTGLDFDECISYAARSDDSCGYVAGQICDLLLEDGHDMKNIAHGFHSIERLLKEIKAQRHCIMYPQLMRVEVERKTGEKSWQSSHSYMVLVHGPDDIHVLQAYVGHYTLDEYLFDDKWRNVREFNDGFSFLEYLELLHALEKESTRGKIYQDLFGSNFVTRVRQKMRIKCRLQPLEPEVSLASLMRTISHIESLVLKHPTLIANSYSDFLKHHLYHKDPKTFDCYKHTYISECTDAQFTHFRRFLAAIRGEAEQDICVQPAKKPQSLAEYLSSEHLCSRFTPGFWTIAAYTGVAVVIGGAVLYALSRGND